MAGMPNPSQAGMNTGDWISAVQNAVQAAAIIVGGMWAYWKFVRGRTFHRRAELEVDASLLSSRTPRVVRAKVTLRNTGAADIPVRAAVLRIFAFAPSYADADNEETGWRRIGTTGVFQDHQWIESQETVTDDVLIELDPTQDQPDALALRATCIVLGKRKRKLLGRKPSTAWTGKGVIPIETTSLPQRTSTKGVLAMPDKSREYQRNVDEDEAKKIEEEEHQRQRTVKEDEAQKIEKEAEAKD
jgi:hypothetical protein